MIQYYCNSPESLLELLPTLGLNCTEATRGLIGGGAGVLFLVCTVVALSIYSGQLLELLIHV